MSPDNPPDDADDERYAPVHRSAWIDGTPAPGQLDHLAREEPLEIRIGGIPIAVVMRTPGDDEDLVRGFLLSERVVASPEQISSLRHCTTVDSPEAEDNVMLVHLATGVEFDIAKVRRNLYASSSCGVCGKATIDAAMSLPQLGPGGLGVGYRIDSNLILDLPLRLREQQAVFTRTGGLHAAGLFTPRGERLIVREDVGRHNALDKAIGAAAAAGIDSGQTLVMVSGRVSYEVVQKALAVGLPMITAVSAPTSLAVDLARRAGITLVGFLRERRFVVYAGDERVFSPLQQSAE